MGIPFSAVFGYHSITVDTEVSKATPRPAEADDLALAAKTRAGDTAAFETLVRRYRNEVFALSYHFVRNREEAWDISQEVFIKAYRSIAQFRGDASFKTWLMRITANHCKDYLKKKRVNTVSFNEAIETGAPAYAAGPDDRLEHQELGAAIERAVDALPVKHREAFVLREYEGLSYQEMAEVMHCNIGTVMSRLHHARRKLQQALIRMGFVEDADHD